MRFITACLFLLAAACSSDARYLPKDGDILFQVSQSAQSQAIQLATGSRYSHMGIVYLRKGEPYVFEAVQPVKLTPLQDWIKRGKDGHFVAKRLLNSATLLSPQVLQQMRSVGERFSGKDYDLYFEWSDERMYCSELVWKIFKRGAGIEIGGLAEMGDFDLSSPAVEAKLHERFGDAVPLSETVVSPSSMFESPMLETVFSN